MCDSRMGRHVILRGKIHGIGIAKSQGMRWMTCGVMLILISSPGWAASRSRPALVPWLLTVLPSTLLARAEAAAPSVSALHHAVLAHAGLNGDLPAVWSKRAKWAAALPRLQLGVRRNLRDDVNLRLEDEVSVSGSGVVIGPRSSDFTERSDRNVQLDIRALWNLNELLFSPDAIFISREARERRDEQRRLLQQANQWISQWQVLMAAQCSADPRIPRTLVEQQRRFIAAELDGLTGGWFSTQVEERR